MSTSPVTFTGSSQFSSDFQQVITRAVNIASLPITQLNAEVATLQGQSSEISSLDTVFTSLQSAVQGLGTSVGLNSYSASSSNNLTASATVSSGAVAGSYTIEVTSLGSFTNTVSNDGLTTVSDPSTQNLSGDSSFTLSINGVDTTIEPAANNLNSLVNAINAQPGLNVQASVVNIGSSGSPDYRLTLQSTKLGPVSLQLSDTSGSLLNQVAGGTLATYLVNGLLTQVNSDSRTVTLAPGLTVSLLAQSPSGQPTTISVSRSTTPITNALNSLVKAYNSAFDQVAKNYGSNGGALTGQSVTSTLSNSLRNLVNYSGGSSGITSLADLGVTLDKTGHLAFDQSVFSSASSSNLPGVISFLGDSTSGFLKNATDLTTNIEDPVNGVLFLTSSSVTKQIAKEQNQITDNQNRVDLLQKNLTARLAAADALIATLEQKVTQITALFTAETAANKAN